VRAAAAQPVAALARELVAGAVPGLSPDAVRVVETPRARPAAPPSFARVGPIVVQKDSEMLLKSWLGGALLLQMLLAAAVLRPLLQRRKRGREQG